MIVHKAIQLEPAQKADLIQIARQSYNLWSGGLRPDWFRYYLNCAYYQPWSKRNQFRLVGKDKDKVLVSCKAANIELIWRKKIFKILGLGAVFTAEEHRGQGLGSSLIELMIQKAWTDNMDGLLIFSDIDPTFYTKNGFCSLGNFDFEIDNRIYSIAKDGIAIADNKRSDIDNNIENRSIQVINDIEFKDKNNGIVEPRFCYSSFSPFLETAELYEILSCHNNWLARQPYGIIRNYGYFTFQLARYVFIANYSKNDKPKLFFSLIKNKKRIVGYAISEYGADYLRVLEVVGPQMVRAELWHNLIAYAQQLGLNHTKGFESVSRDFIPCQLLDEHELGLKPPIKPAQINCYERFWGQPMFLALDNTLNNLYDYNPCPILEFDYL